MAGYDQCSASLTFSTKYCIGLVTLMHFDIFGIIYISSLHFDKDIFKIYLKVTSAKKNENF